jgi:predicted NAD/FAD-binding protein
MKRLAVIGAGWAGLAAAVQATQRGHQVTVYEMAAVPGGRARSIDHGGEVLDNGQHILIGAYRDSLALMRLVGVDPGQVLYRQPLALVDARGRGLALRAGRPDARHLVTTRQVDPAAQRPVMGTATLRGA